MVNQVVKDRLVSMEKVTEEEDEEEEEEIALSDEDEQEDANDYVKGGYHPVKIGDVFENRYSLFLFLN